MWTASLGPPRENLPIATLHAVNHVDQGFRVVDLLARAGYSLLIQGAAEFRSRTRSQGHPHSPGRVSPEDAN